MTTNEEIIQWVKEKLKLLHDYSEEEEAGFEKTHWARLREIRNYVHEKLSIDTSGPIFSFSKYDDRDKNDNEFLLDDILEECFDKNYDNDDEDERNFTVVKKIFDEVRNGNATCNEDRNAAWDIILWFSASSHDDVLGELDVLDDILNEIDEMDFDETPLDEATAPDENLNDITVKVLTYFRVLFLIVVAPEDEDDVSKILNSKCLEEFLDKIGENERMKTVLGAVQTFFMRYSILQHDEDISEEDKLGKRQELETKLPDAIKDWLSTFNNLPTDESLTCLEIDFMTNVLDIFKEVYESEKHGNIDGIVNSGQVTFSEIAEKILAESDREEEILEVFFQFLFAIQAMPGIDEVLEKDGSDLKERLQECYNESDVYIDSEFIFYNESESSDFEDFDDLMDAINADSSSDDEGDSGSHPGSESKAKEVSAKTQAAKDKPLKGKVMISYNWGSQPKARTLKKILIAAGFEVWIDEEGMEEDIVDSMASAVEDSDVIVMCASEKYQKSKNCKSEAKFAYDNDKPVVPVMMENFQREKWLRFIMGTKLYIPFYEDALDPEQTKQFLKIVNKKVSSVKGVEPEKIAETLVENVTEMAPSLKDTATVGKLEESTSAEDLEKWFEKNQLTNIKEKLGKEADAGTILQLKNMKKISPSEYYKMLREDFTLTGVLMLKFDRVIDRI